MRKVRSFFTNPVFFYVIILCFLKPECFGNIGLPGIIVRISALLDKYIGLPVILLCLFALLDNRKTYIGDVAIFYGYKIIATILVTFLATKAITGGGAFSHLRRLAAIWYIATALRYNYKRTVVRLSYLLTVLVVINFLTILLFPHGMWEDDNWQNYFLGYDNGHIVVFMPALFFSLWHTYYTRKHALLIIAWSSVYFSAIICRSGTTVAGLAALMFLLVLIHFPAVRKFLFNWKTVTAIIIGIFVFIIVLRRQEVFQDLMMKYLGKDGTFTGRIYLWDRAFEIIRENRWLGVGDAAGTNVELFTLNTQKLAYAHNEILDILVRSGIIGLLLYIACIARSFRAIRHKKDLRTKSWLAFMTSYWLMMMFESYSNNSFYYFYFVLMIMPRFEELEEQKRKRFFFNGQKNSKKLSIQCCI